MASRFILALRASSLVLASSFGFGLACGDDSAGSGNDSGSCHAKGWQGTCSWNTQCTRGQFWLFCDENSSSTWYALEDMGYALDGSFCLCVIDRDGELEIEQIDYVDDHCLDQFDTSEPGYHDAVVPIVEEICGWNLDN
jgi:hypothetical protein